MTVHFIGAGPGAPDLITVRGRDLVARCPVCLYAGSLVPREIVALAPAGARVLDTAPMHLDEIEAELVSAHERGLDVARLHSGDLSVWSALGEQLRRLERRGIPFTVTPGVPAFAASAAALAQELTLPELSQSVVLTRTSGRASAMPASETLEQFAATRATLAIHLSVHVLESVVERLLPYYGADGAIAVVQRASWPDQKIVRGTLATIVADVRAHAIDSSATILVGAVLGAQDFRESALYSIDYQRRFRGRELVLGIGCERGASSQLLEGGIEAVLSQHGLNAQQVFALATVERKRDEGGLLELAARRGWPLTFYSEEELRAVANTEGSHLAVAEPAARLRAGTRELLIEKTIYRVPGEPHSMTLAVALLASSSPEATAPGR